MITTYKYRLKGKRTVRVLRRHALAVNQVWNYCVEQQKKTRRHWWMGVKMRWPSQYDLQALTKGTSKELGLRAQTIQGVCEQFVKSRDQRRKCPKFRVSAGSRRSLGWVPFQRQSRRTEGNAVTYLKQTFRFFGAKRRPLPASAKGGQFVEDAQGRWWVCFHVEVDPLATGRGEVGIDLGLKTLATMSDGAKIEHIRSYRQLEAKLATAQRAGNRKRTRAIHAQIKNVRQDHLHKATTNLAKDNRLIAIGNVRPMVKTSMAKSVLDASWSTFRDMLRYKASRHGALYLEVDESFTTQTCSACGARSGPKGIAGLGIRAWVCSLCGASHDRDVNSARNILTIGRSAAPRVDGSRGIEHVDDSDSHGLGARRLEDATTRIVTGCPRIGTIQRVRDQAKDDVAQLAEPPKEP